MNKMKLLKIFIMILVIFIIIILGCILRYKKDYNETVSNHNESEDLTNMGTVTQIYMTSDYFTVKDIINQFYLNCKKLNFSEEDLEGNILQFREEEKQEKREYLEEMAQESESLASEVIYGVLDKEYINKFNVSKDSVKEKFGFNNNVETIIEKMYKKQVSEKKSIYLVYGDYIDINKSEVIDFKIIVALDMLNNTFSIYPDEYIEQNIYNNSDEINIDINDNSIENNGYNKYENISIDDKTIPQEYFYNYKNLMIYNIEKAYEFIDKEYKEKRFESIEDYKQYIQTKNEELSKSVLTKYKVVNRDGIKEYICVDQNENFFIFKETENMKYTVLLDTYTVDVIQFINEYNSANSQEKVILNMNKIIAALNAQDYKYIYSKLADSFKNNYFASEEKLKEFLVNNVYQNNSINFEEFSQEGTNLYTYKVRITKIMTEAEKEEYYGKNAPSQYMNIVMQLNEGTDFVMSFSIIEE